MGSKVNTVTNTDNSVIDALAATRGDNNVTQILDAGAIRRAYEYASRVGDNTSNNIGQLLGTFESLAGQTLKQSSEQTKNTLSALQDGFRTSANSIQDAYTKQQNSGLDPQILFLGLGLGVVAIFWIVKG